MTQVFQHQHQDRHEQHSNDVPIQSAPACEGLTELFFSERTTDMRVAQVMCSTCSFREPCLEQARIRPPFAGVWGGIIFVNGEEQLLKRGRGRPRKSEQLDNARLLKTLGAVGQTQSDGQGSQSVPERQIA